MSGSVLLVIALGYGFAALRIPRGEGEPGPGALPLALALALLVLAVWIVAAGVRDGASRKAQSAARDDASIEPSGRAQAGAIEADARLAWGAALATLVYVALFVPLGFAIATSLYAAVLAWLFDRGRGVRLGVSLGLTAVLFVFFQVILGVRLPPGPFG